MERQERQGKQRIQGSQDEFPDWDKCWLTPKTKHTHRFLSELRHETGWSCRILIPFYFDLYVL